MRARFARNCAAQGHEAGTMWRMGDDSRSHPDPLPAGRLLRGVGVSPGRAAGPIARARPQAGPPPTAPDVEEDRVEHEAARVRRAARWVAATLRADAATVAGERRELLEATAQMAADPTLVTSAQELVRTQRTPPALAVWQAADQVIGRFGEIGGYLAARARDVEDVRDRIVAHLSGRPVPGVPVHDHPFVLVALDLAPSETALLDPARVLALVTAEGGPTSHTAILARDLGIPAVVGLGAAAAWDGELSEGRMLLVDGSAGTVEVDPSPESVEVAARPSEVRALTGPGRTQDGHRVELLANIGDPSGAAEAAQAGAEGIGLFRTEFCFLDRTSEPSVAEQAEAYRQVLERFPHKKVVIRTLDAGSDKPLPFVTNARETNPALGLRGLRTARIAPQVLENQLAAIAEAGQGTDAEVWVMAPMVSTVTEAEDFVALCERHGLPQAGVMIEVPSAAMMAGQLLSRATFASLGTNDLIQYTLAADRQLGSLADLSDPWHPAVLRLIEASCQGGAQQGRPVGVCGEMAAAPALAVVLVGLGVTSLSMTPRALGDVAAVLSDTDFPTCLRLARLAADAETAEEARMRVRSELPVLRELGL